MWRLIKTSAGQAVVDLHPSNPTGLGLSVNVTRFGLDGWEDQMKSWYEKWQQETLAQFLVGALGVPGPEATALAQEIVGPWVQEWESRGGAQEARKIGRFTVASLTGLAVLIVLACVAIALLIWLVAT